MEQGALLLAPVGTIKDQKCFLTVHSERYFVLKESLQWPAQFRCSVTPVFYQQTKVCVFTKYYVYWNAWETWKRKKEKEKEKKKEERKKKKNTLSFTFMFVNLFKRLYFLH